MLLKFCKLIILIVLMNLTQTANAQLVQDVNISNEQKAFTKWFDVQVGTESHPIYYGETYPLKMKARNSHQFYGDNKWQNGNVHYGGQWFFDVLLLYDIIDDQLVVKYQNHAISTDMSKIDYFMIGNTSFLKVTSNDSDGFYELLYDGSKVNLLAKHKKKMSLSSQGYEISKSTNYFLASKKELIALKSKRSLKSISPDAAAIARKVKSKEARLNLRKQALLIEFIKNFDGELQ